MSLAVTCVIAAKTLARNAIRTALTALGLIIGVAAVIVMVAIGTGARASIENQIRSAGSNIVMVSAGSGGFGPVRQGQGAVTTLVAADADAIKAQVQGTGASLAGIRSWPLQYGAFFTDADVARAAKVAVLGSVTRDQLFGPGTDATGATIRIKNQPFTVIGVLTSKGQAAMGQDQDDTVIVPYTTVQKRLLGVQHVSAITVSAFDGVDLKRLSDQVTELLRVQHRLQPGATDDFLVRTLEEMASVLTATTDTMTWLLAGIAAVSLLVGGARARSACGCRSAPVTSTCSPSSWWRRWC
jgi:putative ABC transport system permease protein